MLHRSHLAERAGPLEGGPAGQACQAEHMHAGDDHRLVPRIKYLAQACTVSTAGLHSCSYLAVVISCYAEEARSY